MAGARFGGGGRDLLYGSPVMVENALERGRDEDSISLITYSSAISLSSKSPLLSHSPSPSLTESLVLSPGSSFRSAAGDALQLPKLYTPGLGPVRSLCSNSTTVPDPGSLKVGNETDTFDELASSFKSIFSPEKMAEPLFSVGRGREGDEDLNGRWNGPATSAVLWIVGDTGSRRMGLAWIDERTVLVLKYLFLFNCGIDVMSSMLSGRARWRCLLILYTR